jgi:hypothetical protein
MRGSATNLDIRSVGLENTGHRILAAPVVITIVVIAVIIIVPVAHTLVVLTVSHVLPLFQPRVKSVGLMVCDVRGATQAHHGVSKRDTAPSRDVVVNRRVQQRRVPQQLATASEPLIQPAATGPVVLRKSSSSI